MKFMARLIKVWRFARDLGDNRIEALLTVVGWMKRRIA